MTKIVRRKVDGGGGVKSNYPVALPVLISLREVPTDKDGISRPNGSAYDIGAYESF